jgi:hypothetical protein
VSFADDEDPVGALASSAADPALRVVVRVGDPTDDHRQEAAVA